MEDRKEIDWAKKFSDAYENYKDFLYLLIDTGRFNSIIFDYAVVLMNNIGVDKNLIKNAHSEFTNIRSFMTAKEVEKQSMKILVND